MTAPMSDDEKRKNDTEETFEGYLRRRLGENYTAIVVAALDALADNADDETLSERCGRPFAIRQTFKVPASAVHLIDNNGTCGAPE